MIQNPYAAPQSDVSIDFATTTNSRPHLVWVASFLLCSSMIIGIIGTALRWDSKVAALMVNLSTNYKIAIGLVTFAFLSLFLWFTYKIWCGRNWARIAMLIWIALGFISPYPKIPSTLENMTIHEYLTFSKLIVEVLGVYIVFATSARHWFSRSRVAEKPSKAGETRAASLSST